MARSGHRKGRISRKMFVTIMAIMIACMVFITFANRPILYSVLARQTAAQLNNVKEEILSLDQGSVTYYFDLNSIGINNNVIFEMIDSDGALIYTSESSSSALSSSHFPSSGSASSEFSQTARTAIYPNFTSGNDVFEKRQKIASNADYFVLTSTDNDITIHIFSPVAVIDSNVNASFLVIFFIVLFIVIVFSAVILFYVRRFASPLVEMNDITKDMASLNFSRKCKVYSNDEIGELGLSINTLSDTLNDTLIDLREKNEQLERDIERRFALDEQRKSFINNVSHELKTPISIIMGYAEGLSAGISNDPEDIKEYINVINDESKKMNSLVTELLELSKIESKIAPFTPEIYNLSELISETFNHFSLIFEKHGIAAENKVPKNVFCYSQKDRIEIVLKNYINNAISHCSGDKKIEITLKESGNKIRVSVFNTGDQIDEADLPEIWESFYRADKSHKRSENRFGLGLSIVKSIMYSHNEECGVDNNETGVTFWFELSKGAEKNEN